LRNVSYENEKENIDYNNSSVCNEDKLSQSNDNDQELLLLFKCK